MVARITICRKCERILKYGVWVSINDVLGDILDEMIEHPKKVELIEKQCPECEKGG